MPSPDEQASQTFLQCWMPELQTAIEMFAGQSVSVLQNSTGSRDDLIQNYESIFWSGHKFICGDSAPVWVGTSARNIQLLLGSVAEETADQQSLFQELLEQSFAGAIHQLNGQRAKKFESGECLDHFPEIDSFDLCFELKIEGQPEISLWVLLQESTAQIFREEESHSTPASSPDTDRFSHLQFSVSVVLGRSRVPIREVLKFTNGSVVELDKTELDAIEVVVHGRVVARGEVVSVQGNYGIRVKHLMSRDDRMNLGYTGALSEKGGVYK